MISLGLTSSLNNLFSYKVAGGNKSDTQTYAIKRQLIKMF